MKVEQIKIGKKYSRGSAVRNVLDIRGDTVIFQNIMLTYSSGKKIELDINTFAEWAKYESLGYIPKRCKKDWFFNDEDKPRYIKGKTYIGEVKKDFEKLGEDKFTVKDENGILWAFYTGSEHFNI